MFEKLKSNKKKLDRFEHILAVFFEHGFDYLIDQTHLKTYIPFQKRVKKTISKSKEMSFPVQLRKALEELGPTFVKLGQVLSLRPDLIPAEYITEFEKMLDTVPSFSTYKAKEILELELKQSPEKLFTTFSNEPIAAASLAQVHKAKLKTGEIVAVKIQRPNIEEIVKTDTEIMLYIAQVIDKQFNNYNFHLESIIKEFQRWTKRELNFEIEAAYAEKLYENHKHSKIMQIPKVYREYTSQKILTTEFIDGIEINQITKIKRLKINTDKIVQNGIEALMTQIFDHGLFHADPHPGNIFVKKNGTLATVDFGIIGQFSPKLKKHVLNISLGILKDDLEQVTNNLMALDPNKQIIDKQEFQRRLQDIMLPIQTGTFKRSTFTNTLTSLISLSSDYKLKLPIDFILFGKTLLTLEGVAMKYNPDIQIGKESYKILKKIISKKHYSQKIIEDIKQAGFNIINSTQDIPDYTKDVLERLRSGNINVDIENKDVNSIVSEMQILSGNISFGMIIGGLLVASSLILTQFYYLGMAGFLLALILGLILIKNISTANSPFQKE